MEIFRSVFIGKVPKWDIILSEGAVGWRGQMFDTFDRLSFSEVLFPQNPFSIFFCRDPLEFHAVGRQLVEWKLSVLKNKKNQSNY